MFKIIIRNIAFLGLLSVSLSSMAGVNPLTVSLQAGASTSISQGSTGTADYLVALNPQVPGSLTLALTGGLPSGVTQVTTGIGCGAVTACTSTFNLTPGGQCCLKLLMTGSNMTLGNNVISPLVQTTPIHTYSGRGDVLNVAVTNAVSNTNITVSANGVIPVNGSPGTLTVTNTGPNTAYNVRAVLPGAWTGVTQDATGCTTIANQGSCTLSFTSTTPYLAQGGITVTGDNITTPPTTAIAFSIQGYLVFALSSTSSPLPQVIDSSNLLSIRWGTGSEVISGSGAQSKTDGFTNTAEINATANITPSAAVDCYNSTSGGLAEVGTWYLPAICQMGGSGQGASCSNSNTTTIYNLYQLGFVSLTGLYWSSTEYDPTDAWIEDFVGSFQGNLNKLNSNRVRCARAIA